MSISLWSNIDGGSHLTHSHRLTLSMSVITLIGQAQCQNHVKEFDRVGVRVTPSWVKIWTRTLNISAIAISFVMRSCMRIQNSQIAC